MAKVAQLCFGLCVGPSAKGEAFFFFVRGFVFCGSSCVETAKVMNVSHILTAKSFSLLLPHPSGSDPKEQQVVRALLSALPLKILRVQVGKNKRSLFQGATWKIH